MSKYSVTLYYPNGYEETLDELFDTEEEANDCAGDLAGCYSVGAETLFLSNPGDYPLSDEGIDWEVNEVED